MKEKREEKRARRRASDPEELAKAQVPADMKERTSAEQSVSLAGAWRTVFKLLSTTRRRSARAFFVFLAIAIGWSAYPQNENIRAQEPKPSFEHQVAYITARISIRPLGSVKKEMHGTGFFYRSNFTLKNRWTRLRPPPRRLRLRSPSRPGRAPSVPAHGDWRLWREHR